MQTQPPNVRDRNGVVQWVSPSSPQIQQEHSEQPLIDIAICRTICIFVNQHLEELREHQKAIDRVRSKQQEFESANYITRNDTLKLKVRDEQTKATESIKRLNNYLKELSYLIKQYDLEANDIKQPQQLQQQQQQQLKQVDGEIIAKLSDLRTDIIQALNDFVLSNGDIDVPIIDSDDIQNYDLCFDAQDGSTNGLSRLSNGSSVVKSSYDHSTSYSIIDQSASLIDFNDQAGIKQQQQQQQQQHQTNPSDVDQRRREIRKLERDTVELRRLFSDFYNLVKLQGETLDTIEDNIVITTQRISEGQHNINKALKGLTIIVPFTGCMAGALIGGPIGVIIGGKLGGITIGCATSLLGLISSYGAQRCITANKIKVD